MSAVIANYNHARFVVEAVESVLAQTYPRVEVVVVDDASTDDSLDRLARFGDHITVVALGRNGGHALAMEAGVRASTGELVCLLDADDRWLPAKVERVVEVFARRPGLTQLSHGLWSIDAEGRPISGRRPSRGSTRMLERRMALSEGDVRSLLFRWNRYGCAISSGLAYPRWVLERALPVPERFAGFFFDTWVTVAAPFFGPVGALGERLMEYRVHGGNAAAGAVDFPRYCAWWEATAAMVDHWAEATGDPRRSALERSDNRLPLFRYLGGEPVPWTRRMRALARTPLELRAIGAQPLDGAMSFAERAVMASSRRHGAEIKRIGLNRWLRQLGRPGRPRVPQP